MCGISPDVVSSILGEIPDPLKILEICKPASVNENQIKETQKAVKCALVCDDKEWFAMRLRPGVKYESLIERFAQLSGVVNMRKIVWTGKPIIRDVVFFRYRITEIYSLFTHIYDLAWCYRNPGIGSNKYAAIPAKAMEEFKEAIGFLRPGYEIKPAGEMELQPGDEVIIVTGDYAKNRAKILKSQLSTDEFDSPNKIFRVVLLDQNGKWEIGIDARSLKKVEK